MSGDKQVYLWAKGDTLESVAKKFKVDAKAIWKDADNKSLVGKRGKPEALMVRDAITIPPNEKDAKAAAQKLEQLRQMRDVAGALLETLNKEDERSRRRVKVYAELMAGTRQSTIDIVNELKATLAKMKGFGETVDAVATVAQITASLTTICAKGMQATKLTGAALEKMNEELTKEVVKMPVDQLKDVGIKFTGELRERTDSPIGYVGELAKSWEKMTAPSFWANTFVQMTQNGKSWSDAVAMDVGDDIQERMKQVVAEGAKQIQKLEQQTAAAKALEAANQKYVAECQARIKWCEQEVAKAGGR